MKKVFKKMLSTASVVYFTAIGSVFAQNNPFAEGVDKGNELVEYLTGDLAKLVVTLSLVGVAFFYMFGKLPKELAARLAIGCAILLSIQSIVGFIFN